eukprot:gene9039-10006_t
MSGARSASRQSPLIRIEPPKTTKLRAEEKTEQGENILQRLQQTGSMTSLARSSVCSADSERRQSCIQIGLGNRSGDIKTIKTKVKSAESLNAKSLLGADLLKNLKRFRTQDTKRVDLDPRRCQTAEAAIRSLPQDSRKTHHRAMSAVNSNSSSLSAGAGLQDARSRRSCTTPPNQATTVGNVNRRMLRRGSLPVEAMSYKTIAAESILKKYNSRNHLDENIETLQAINEKNNVKEANKVGKSSLPLVTRTRCVSHPGQRSKDAGKNIEVSKSRSTLDVSVAGRRGSTAGRQRLSSAISCGSDDVDEENTCLMRGSPDSSDTSDRESESHAKSGRISEKGKQNQRHKSRINNNNIGSSDDESSNESDEDKKLKPGNLASGVKGYSKSNRTPSVINCDSNDYDNVDDNGSSGEDESRGNENAPMRKEMVAGMPVLDIRMQQEHQPRKERSKSVQSEAELADDVDDLIDAIDDIIEADDEDIAYEASMENKQARKAKSSFKKTANFIMAAKRVNKN